MTKPTRATTMTLWIGKLSIAVATFAEASEAWSAHRSKRQMGASAMPEVGVVEANGTRRAVAYNGKVLACAKLAHWTSTVTVLHDPFDPAAHADKFIIETGNLVQVRKG